MSVFPGKAACFRVAELKSVVVLMLAMMPAMLSGCSDENVQEEEEMPPEAQHSEYLRPVRDQSPAGTVMGMEYRSARAMWANGSLKLHQQKEDGEELTVEVITFAGDNVAGRTITGKADDKGVRPHILVGHRRNSTALPDVVPVTDDYDLQLHFGTAQTLGVPFSLLLKVPQQATVIEGKGFATYSDIRVVNGQLDTRYETLDTLKMLGRLYIKGHWPERDPGKVFGAYYWGYKGTGLKYGFVGFETRLEDQQIPVKLQFVKKDGHWQVGNLLAPDEITQAHLPEVVTRDQLDERSWQSRMVVIAAAKELEAQAREAGIAEDIRSTRVDCYLSKDLNHASCLHTYGQKEAEPVTDEAGSVADEELQCVKRNFLLQRKDDVWNFVREIKQDMKMDYSSGQLEHYTPFHRGC